jgi:hypothetical protein
MISFNVNGDFKTTLSKLKQFSKLNVLEIMASYGEEGVAALSSATPTDTGLAAGAWSYDVHVRNGTYTIAWTNTDVEHDFPVVIMLQYGYGTGSGGYVQGRDYINPAIKPVFDQIADKVWKAVTSG